MGSNLYCGGMEIWETVVPCAVAGLIWDQREKNGPESSEKS